MGSSYLCVAYAGYPFPLWTLAGTSLLNTAMLQFVKLSDIHVLLDTIDSEIVLSCVELFRLQHFGYNRGDIHRGLRYSMVSKVRIRQRPQ